MKLLVLISTLVATSLAAPQGYSLGTPSGPSFGIGGPGPGFGSGGCGHGQVLHVDGRCVTPRVNRKVYLYDAPPAPPISYGPPPYIPEPTIDTNIVFIRIPEGGQGPDPIVVPPPQQKHVLYVLNKQTQQGQEVIEVPAPPATSPEVYFVNYADGENPVLPSGVDLQSALNAASQGGGQVIGGGVGGGFGGGIGFGGGAISGGFVSGGHSGEFISGGSSGGFISGGGFGGGSSVVSTPSNLYSTP
ncbi:ATP-dependent RNA helicase A-like [Penaeus monodon]|uniref:ATP-dependent RNA helicase A-like n=1 Tax=Penaeus monodon TaxID=6687 RepID=UPI0018A7ABF1|nr:ATP-dependent RNA helicase A-like [Penaeus monodon]